MPASLTRLVLVLAAVVVAVAAVFAAGAAAARGDGRTVSAVTAAATSPVTATQTNGIAVSGTGQAPGTPDVLRLDMGVSTTAGSAPDALDKASRSMAKVLDALEAGGVAKADLRTTGLSLDPTYDYSASKGQRIIGYTATTSVTATLRDLGKAGRVIERAVNAGGDAARLQGVSLDLDHDDAVVAKAREAAFADAKAKAQAYAKAAGRELGAVALVSEDSTGGQPIALDSQAFAARASAGVAAPVPVQPGSTQVGVTVHVVWSFA